MIPRRWPGLVLTPEEKRALLFVIAAFLLGLATKHYRDQHRQTPPSSVEHTQPAESAADTDE